MAFLIKLAEQIIEIHPVNSMVKVLYSNYEYNGNSAIRPSLQIYINKDDIDKEARIQECMTPKVNVFSNNNIFLAYENRAIHRKICESIPQLNVFLMHGSVIAYKDVGYMFSAPSGVGKSTRTKLWRQEFPGSIVVNGDKPLIQVKQDGVYAYGTPWCGKEYWNNNIGIKLQAIFILERAIEDESDTIYQIDNLNAYDCIFSQAYKPQNTSSLIKTLKLIDEMKDKVCIYRFRSNPTRESVRLAWETANP